MLFLSLRGKNLDFINNNIIKQEYLIRKLKKNFRRFLKNTLYKISKCLYECINKLQEI